jgi:hypothetical protein
MDLWSNKGDLKKRPNSHRIVLTDQETKNGATSTMETTPLQSLKRSRKNAPINLLVTKEYTTTKTTGPGTRTREHRRK